MIRTWLEADSACRYKGSAKGAMRDSRVIARNTKVIRGEEGSLHIQLHETNVVSYHPTGTIELDSGGWQTVTTSDRISRFSPFDIFTGPGSRWYVKHLAGYSDESRATAFPFVDHMVIAQDANARWEVIAGGLDLDDVEKANRHNHRINRLINKWLTRVDSTTFQCGTARFAPGEESRQIVRRYTGVEWDHVPKTCALCCVVPGGDQGVFAGDAMGSHQHLVDHLINNEYDPLVISRLSSDPTNIYNLTRSKAMLKKQLQMRLLAPGTTVKNGRVPVGR